MQRVEQRVEEKKEKERSAEKTELSDLMETPYIAESQKKRSDRGLLFVCFRVKGLS